jgi:hypothetical protein
MDHGSDHAHADGWESRCGLVDRTFPALPSFIQFDSMHMHIHQSINQPNNNKQTFTNMQQLTPEQYHSLYKWIDTLPLNKVKKNIARDFSDGTLTAQLLHIFEPKLVDLHNYTASLAIAKKRDNWVTLNQKVLKKLGTPISQDQIESIIKGDKGAIEHLLVQIQFTIISQADEKIYITSC